MEALVLVSMDATLAAQPMIRWTTLWNNVGGRAAVPVKTRIENPGQNFAAISCKPRSYWSNGPIFTSRMLHNVKQDGQFCTCPLPRPVLARAMAEERRAAAVSVGEKSPSSEETVDEEDATNETGVIVIGAGLAGLAAARQLALEGIPFRVVEASNEVGGRVKTDNFKGFLLDRGFQIHITAYPESARILDYSQLDLKSFYAGASVWFNGKFHRVADPFRHFTHGLLSLTNPIGSVWDKVLVGIVRFRAAVKSGDEILGSEEMSIEERLARNGFSQAMIDRFFRPFFGGIFFDRELQTTSRLFDFVFKCLALGSNTLPGGGIGAIPEQLASGLPTGSIMFNSKVVELNQDAKDGIFVGVKLENGTVLTAKYGVVVAVEGPESARLLKNELDPTPSMTNPPRSTTCLYFSSDKSPTTEPILFLNGSGKGIVNNMFFPATVAPAYAPRGKTLVSVSLIGTFDGTSDSQLEQRVKEELSDWFGAGNVNNWEHLRTYRIPFAQPDQTPPTDLRKSPRVCNGVYICGDHRDSSTFDGALVSGRRAAQALIADKLAIS